MTAEKTIIKIAGVCIGEKHEIHFIWSGKKKNASKKYDEIKDELCPICHSSIEFDAEGVEVYV